MWFGNIGHTAGDPRALFGTVFITKHHTSNDVLFAMHSGSDLLISYEDLRDQCRAWIANDDNLAIQIENIIHPGCTKSDEKGVKVGSSDSRKLCLNNYRWVKSQISCKNAMVINPKYMKNSSSVSEQKTREEKVNQFHISCAQLKLFSIDQSLSDSWQAICLSIFDVIIFFRAFNTFGSNICSFTFVFVDNLLFIELSPDMKWRIEVVSRRAWRDLLLLGSKLAFLVFPTTTMSMRDWSN